MFSSRVLHELELVTRRLVTATSYGEQKSSKLGGGFEFHQLRDYFTGDDVRSIDWKSSARHNKLVIKEFVEERNKTVVVLFDISASLWYGSQDVLKIDIAAQLATVLSFAAAYHNDSVALVVFADEVIISTKAAKGATHIRQALDSLAGKLSSWPQHSRGTNYQKACDFIQQRYPKNSLVCVISDFIGCAPSDSDFTTLAHRYDVIGFKVVDRAEEQPLCAELLAFEDSEKPILFENSAKFCATLLEDATKKPFPLYVAYAQPLDLDKLIRFFRQRRVQNR